MAGAPARELDVRVGVFRGPVVVQQGIGAGEGRARTKEDSQQEGGDQPPGHALITPRGLNRGSDSQLPSSADSSVGSVRMPSIRRIAYAATSNSANMQTISGPVGRS